MFLGLFSVFSFLLTLSLIPWLIIRIPADYFAYPNRQSLLWHKPYTPLKVIAILLKNAAGIILLLLGIALLVLPGQGILTMITGLFLMNFPGKFKVERWFIQQPSILKSINWLRKRRGRKHLVLE